MGIETVAVYSDADARALHTTLADRAVHIGPAAAADSYLSIERLVAAARQTGADAIHPGYGFLSENETFAAACADADVTFIGPPPAALALMGSKIAARRAAEQAGVPVVPGGIPEDQSDAALQRVAATTGFPVLLKPAEGGGGIGMKVVRDADALLGAAAQARREAEAAFGDGTLYVERLIERPRHIEIQILADAHGHVVHLFERECSLQRRHQKVVEESPSTAVSPALRRRLGEAAVAIARAAGYRNAGTVEFLVEGTGDQRAVLLPRDERPAAGGASDHGSRDRRGPGAGATRDRCRRAAAVHAGVAVAARPRDRSPHLRGGSEPAVSSPGRPAASLPSSPRCPASASTPA